MKNVKGLRADFETGEGEVDFKSSEINSHDSVFKLDVMKDWIYSLAEKYEAEFKKLYGIPCDVKIEIE